jgi:hypothetical protein
MACCVDPLCLPVAGCAVVGGAAVFAHLPGHLLAVIELLAITPLLCVAFTAPAGAGLLVSARHLLEWDEDRGALGGVDEDSVIFDAEGNVLPLDDSVYCPPCPEAEAEAALARRRKGQQEPADKKVA